MYSEGFRSSIWKYVVEHNLVNYVPRMVALGCDINLTNKAGETPLIWACSVPFQSAADSEYRFQLVQALVEQAGANINHVTKAGASVLQVAIECHFWHAAHYLAASGAVVYNTSRKRVSVINQFYGLHPNPTALHRTKTRHSYNVPKVTTMLNSWDSC
jgi:hypothetical protein